jgi:zinc transport system substrate-binding protein
MAYARIARSNMKKIIGIILIIFILIAVFLIAKNNSSQTSQSNKIQVTASFYPMYYFSSVIGGDKATVQNITPAGAEPHDYDPSTRDIANIQNSKLLVLNGGSLEAWGNKLKDNLQGTNTVIVTAGEGLTTRTVTEEGKTGTDPHVWLDPILAKQEVARINQGFDKADQANSSYYDANAKQLDAKLDQLNVEYKQGLQSCQQKDIITSHAAFGYLGAQYGLTQVPISGLSPDAEPSNQQLADVTNFARAHNVKYIFFESLVSPKLSDTIANEVGAKTLVLDPIEGLSNDDIQAGKNYFTVMQQNLHNLQLALQCSK